MRQHGPLRIFFWDPQPVSGGEQKGARLAQLALVLLALTILLAGVEARLITEAFAAGARGSSSTPLKRIQHIVVIYEENHSFDNLYGGWERVDGLSRADARHTNQFPQRGKSYKCLRQVDVNLSSPPLRADACSEKAGDPFDSHFPNKPFEINAYISPWATTCPDETNAYNPQNQNGILKGDGEPGGCTRDLVHRFYQSEYQLDGGKMDHFVTGSDAVGLTMGYYRTENLPIWQWLHRDGHPSYAILDKFFQAAFGGSFLNHQWLIAAATPVYPYPPAEFHAVIDKNGMPTNYPLYTTRQKPKPHDGPLTVKCPSPVPRLACGNDAVNTMQPAFQPTGSHGDMLPPQRATTIGDELSDAGIGWAWYSGGWSNAAGLVGAPGWTNGSGTRCSDPRSKPNPRFPYCPNKVFQYHHQPFDYFAKYGPGTLGRTHLRDEEEFIQLTQSSKTRCRLKPVSFVKPLGQENEHPGYASEHNGSKHLVELLKAIEHTKCAGNTMVIVTYDEFGGQWDHVPPPGQTGTSGPHDEWGPGPRVPALVISPFLRGRFVVDHTQHDTTSILATIEHRYGLAPLSARDKTVKDLSSVFSAT
jgi:acid phosphatase